MHPARVMCGWEANGLGTADGIGSADVGVRRRMLTRFGFVVIGEEDLTVGIDIQATGGKMVSHG